VRADTQKVRGHQRCWLLMCMSALPNPDVGEGIEPLSPKVARRLRVLAALAVAIAGLFTVFVAVADLANQRFFQPSPRSLRVIAAGTGIALLAGGMLLMGGAVRHQQRRRKQHVRSI